MAKPFSVLGLKYRRVPQIVISVTVGQENHRRRIDQEQILFRILITGNGKFIYGISK